MRQSDFNKNNLDLLRLLAAFHVTLHHAASHLAVSLDTKLMIGWLDYIPGVPIFFFISGFLISRSWERNPSLPHYIRNRFLRIYPALIIVTLLTLSLLYATGYFSTVEVEPFHLIGWVLGQVSFVQFYNPDFLRGFGVGVANGALWTIAVELQFYILTPLLYLLLPNQSRRKSNLALLALIAFFVAINRGYYSFEGQWGDAAVYKLFGITFTPWYFMFLTGVFFQRNHHRMQRFLAEKFIFVLPLYALSATMLELSLGMPAYGNYISPLPFFLLAATCYSFAYSHGAVAQRILKRNDISYGLYIYHMPIINTLIFLGYGEGDLALITGITTSIALAMLSWFLVEKPALRLKPAVHRPKRPGSSSIAGLPGPALGRPQWSLTGESQPRP